MVIFSGREAVQIVDEVQAVAILFGKKFTSEELKVWVKAFASANFTVAEVQGASASFLGDAGLAFFPTFPQWVKAARGNRNHAHAAIEAWDTLVNWLETRGVAWMRGELKAGHGDPFAVALRAIGGLDSLGDASYDQLAFMRKTFLSTYAAKADSLPAEKMPEIENPKTMRIAGVISEIADKMTDNTVKTPSETKN